MGPITAVRSNHNLDHPLWDFFVMPRHIPADQCDTSAIMVWHGRAVTLRLADPDSNTTIESGTQHPSAHVTLKVMIHANRFNALVDMPVTDLAA
ncbi:hypothetical protein FRC06_008403 [Ceratobasidium sp. 370]|nr:hypothetical protein FRC06_008403 [Ceratobasidium sp. 370]